MKAGPAKAARGLPGGASSESREQPNGPSQSPAPLSVAAPLRRPEPSYSYFWNTFRGWPTKNGTMSDLQTLAATLLAKFATVRIPRCESLWISSVPNLSPTHRYKVAASCARTRDIHHELSSSAPPISTTGARPSRILRPDRGRWTRRMAATLLLPEPGGHRRIRQYRGRVCVLATPWHSIPNSLSCTGSANWSVLGV